MQTELGTQEKFLTSIEQKSKRFELISLYNLANYLAKNGYHVQFGSSRNFTISPSLVEEINVNGTDVKITLNFIAFFGYGGLLHDYLHEMFIYDRNYSLLDFLNIFYNRAIEVLFEIKKVYYPFFARDLYKNMYTSITGLTQEKQEAFLPYGMYFINNTRSKPCLIELISSFTNMKVEIEEFTGTSHPFDVQYQGRLIKTHFLNGEKHIGRKFLDQSSTFDVILYPQTEAEFQWLDDSNIKKLKILIQKFINGRLEFNLFAFMGKSNQCILKNIKNNPRKLGWYTFISLKEQTVQRLFEL